MNTLPEQLKAYRKREGIPARIAAAHLGVPEATWQNWESGRNQPRGLTLKAVLQFIQPTENQNTDTK